jgi:DNA-binding NarL/FixJ family response regulator
VASRRTNQPHRVEQNPGSAARPRAAPPAGRANGRSDEAVEPAPAKRAVLYVDDPALTNALRDALCGAGFEVLCVGTFQSVALWLMFPRGPVVLVVQVPSIDMFRRTTLREVRRAAPTVPVVALVPAITTEVREDTEHAQVDEVLTTNAQPIQIVEAVQRALANRPSSSTRTIAEDSASSPAS